MGPARHRAEADVVEGFQLGEPQLGVQGLSRSCGVLMVLLVGCMILFPFPSCPFIPPFLSSFLGKETVFVLCQVPSLLPLPTLVDLALHPPLSRTSPSPLSPSGDSPSPLPQGPPPPPPPGTPLVVTP